MNFLRVFTSFAISYFLAIGLASQRSLAATSNAPEDFLNASLQVCKTRAEKLSYLRVPALLGNEKAILNLAYWIKKAKNPTTNYLVLIPGGPGQTFFDSEWSQFPNLNLVYFDPRGVGCSMPDQAATLDAPDFNTSEGIVRDLEALRKHLGLLSWNVYAHSYGTVPASMYASQFPSSVRKLILEGSVAAGGAHLWEPQGIEDLFKRSWAALSSETREQAQIKLACSPWFSEILLSSLPQNSGIDEVNERVQRFLTHPRCNAPVSPMVIEDNPGVFASRAFFYVSCNELGANAFSVDRHYLFDGQQTKPWPSQSLLADCKSYVNHSRLFESRKHPLKIPVIFFQGENDILTTQAEAYQRFIELKKNNSQTIFFSLKKGGHNPLSLALETYNAGTPTQALTIDFVENLLQQPLQAAPHSYDSWLQPSANSGDEWTIQ